jgi:hypothetical protein
VQAYVRNPANALAQLATYVGVALLSGTFLYKVGSIQGMLGLNIMIGTSGERGRA